MKILVSVDGSACSEAATRQLVAQIKPLGAEVRLLHVVEPFPVDSLVRWAVQRFPTSTPRGWNDGRKPAVPRLRRPCCERPVSA